MKIHGLGTIFKLELGVSHVRAKRGVQMTVQIVNTYFFKIGLT